VCEREREREGGKKKEKRKKKEKGVHRALPATEKAARTMVPATAIARAPTNATLLLGAHRPL
jgi:hypothetical protein